MTTNVNDLYIGGRDETLTSSIKTPQGFTTEMFGNVDIKDRVQAPPNPKDEGKLMINGRTIGDFRKEKTFTPTDDLTLNMDDNLDVDTYIFDFKSIPEKKTVLFNLSLITSVYPKKITVILKNVKKGKYNYLIVKSAGNAQTNFSASDWLCGKRQILNSRWLSMLSLDHECSFDLYTMEGTQTAAPVGTGNNWDMRNSHNINPDFLHLNDVYNASSGNETLGDLVVGYTFNGTVLNLGDRILLKDQTDKSENGIYIVGDGTAFDTHRSFDLYEGQTVATTLIHNNEDNKTYKILNFGDVVGTDDLEINADGEIGVDVVQQTSITTAVSANGDYGEITTVSSTLASNGQTSFILNNSKIVSTSIIQVWISNYDGAGFPMVLPSNPDTGEVEIQLRNVHNSAALNDTIKIGYRII